VRQASAARNANAVAADRELTPSLSKILLRCPFHGLVAQHEGFGNLSVGLPFSRQT
jgi:hypothetical protein